jgi:PA14 domain
LADPPSPPRKRRARVALGFAVVLGLWTVIALCRFQFFVRPGLHAHYFSTVDLSGSAHSVIDSLISTEQISRDWDFKPPDTFSARWSGYVYVDRPGTHTFATTSADRSQIYLDDEAIVANDGTHGTVTSEARRRLDRGSHAIVIEYLHSGGPYHLEWSSAADGQPLAPVPAWLLSTRPKTLLSLLLIRTLDWLFAATGALAFFLVAWLAFLYRDALPEQALSSVADSHLSQNRRHAFLTLALFAALTVVQTWPLATDPAHLSRNDNADTNLNEWTLAWFAHQLPRHPLQLFDGNMFYPEHHTVAYAETMLVQDAMAAPVLWLGGSPVLAYNLVLMAGFTLTGWAMCLAVTRWTNDRVAGIAAGVLMAFNAHTLSRMPHLQAQHVEFLPFALMSLDSLLRRPRWTSAIWLAIWFTLQALTSVYLLVFTSIALVACVLVRPEDWRGGRLTSVAPMLALAGTLAGIVLAPFLLPYWRLHEQGFSRSLDEIGFFAAQTRDYLTTPSRFHTYAGGAVGLFPGTIALTLAAVAVVSLKVFTDARARMCLAFGVCGVVLSFGPAIVPGYEFFYRTVPILQGVRTTARFGYLGLVAIAVLAGYGVAILRQQLTHQRVANIAMSLAVVALVFVEPLAIPIWYARFDGIPSIYSLPASDPQAVVAEMPLAPPERQFRDAAYVLNSTLNWKPLLNGYSGFIPPSYEQHYLAMKDFPKRASIDALRTAGVTNVFVDFDRLDAAAAEELDREPALHRRAIQGTIGLYNLDPARAVP